MPFPFTFRFTLPGLLNPFSAVNESPQVNPIIVSNVLDNVNKKLIAEERASRVPRRPSPSISSHSRKRAWDPTFAEPSPSATTLASGSGYLDTPAKYRDLATPTDDFHEIEAMSAEMAAEMPPAKRRRGLAGSIVSTALSAALIGAAVGLTVYRSWRARGREAEQVAPPPYDQGGWTPEEEPSKQPKAIVVTPATPRGRRVRHLTKRTPRKHRPRVHGASPPPSAPFFPQVQPQFNFGQDAAEEAPVEDQMDWIGDKLSMLIEEGKRALGREVVVMSETQEDELDDGSGSWEEDETLANSSRSASPRRGRRKLQPQSYPSSASPRSTRFDLSPSAPIGIPTSTSHSTPSSSFREEASEWSSPAMRESMERARALALARKNRGL
ncbi:hypothetical protein C8J56DRAFT_940841 [Mycena floridula]|nr:hypothetical protein C8J56DRAFT_940841 [Mycena floridula]